MKENLVLKIRLCSSIVYHLEIIYIIYYYYILYIIGLNVSMKIQYLKFACPIMN